MALKCNSSICYRLSCSYLPFVSLCMLRVTQHPNYCQKLSLSFQRVIWVGDAHTFGLSEGSLIITGTWIYWKCCFSPLTLLVSEASPMLFIIVESIEDCNLLTYSTDRTCPELLLQNPQPLNCFFFSIEWISRSWGSNLWGILLPEGRGVSNVLCSVPLLLPQTFIMHFWDKFSCCAVKEPKTNLRRSSF